MLLNDPPFVLSTTDRESLANIRTALGIAQAAAEQALLAHRQSNFLAAHAFNAAIVAELEQLLARIKVAAVANRAILAGETVSARFGGPLSHAPHCSR